MAKFRGIEKSQVDFNDILRMVQNSIFARLNCHNVGRIVDFDKETQTATIEIMQMKQFNNTYFDPAPITNVPLIIYGAGNGHITLPDPVGSICLLFFNDRNMDSFLETGEKYTPETARMHDITDCIALTTFKTLNNPIQNYDDKAISIFMNEIVEDIQNESFIKVYSNSIQLKTQSGETGSAINLAEKINIQNNLQNLALLIQEFLSACESITTVNGGGLTSDSAQLFSDLKTKFEDLLI